MVEPPPSNMSFAFVLSWQNQSGFIIRLREVCRLLAWVLCETLQRSTADLVLVMNNRWSHGLLKSGVVPHSYKLTHPTIANIACYAPELGYISSDMVWDHGIASSHKYLKNLTKIIRPHIQWYRYGSQILQGIQCPIFCIPCIIMINRQHIVLTESGYVDCRRDIGRVPRRPKIYTCHHNDHVRHLTSYLGGVVVFAMWWMLLIKCINMLTCTQVHNIA